MKTKSQPPIVRLWQALKYLIPSRGNEKGKRGELPGNGNKWKLNGERMIDPLQAGLPAFQSDSKARVND